MLPPSPTNQPRQQLLRWWKSKKGFPQHGPSTKTAATTTAATAIPTATTFAIFFQVLLNVTKDVVVFPIGLGCEAVGSILGSKPIRGPTGS